MPKNKKIRMSDFTLDEREHRTELDKICWHQKFEVVFDGGYIGYISQSVRGGKFDAWIYNESPHTDIMEDINEDWHSDVGVHKSKEAAAKAVVAAYKNNEPFHLAKRPYL